MRIRLAALGVITTLLAACSTTDNSATLGAPPLDNPPALAAEYETTIEQHEQRGDDHTDHNHHTHHDKQTWRVWRDETRVEVQQLDSDSGEVWMRSGASVASGSEPLFFLRLFHADRTAIEYAPTELSALGMSGNWQRAQLLIDPAVLQQLQPVSSAKRLGRRAVIYRGEINGERISIDWLVDDRMPARIERRSDKATTVVTLREIHALAQSPWQRPDSATYRVIDYADLGDMERDPFVQRVLSMIPGGENHQHSH